METIEAKRRNIIDWVKQLDNEETLNRLEMIKENEQPLHWNELPEKVKQSLRQADEDIKAGRVISDEEFKKKHGI